MSTPDTNAIRCELCIAFHAQNAQQGLCRRNVPQTMAVVMPVKSVAAAGIEPRLQIITAWPTVKNGEGCLQFELPPAESLINVQ